jgi:uncharacterized protein YgbK (DUF1537 family)
MHVGKQTARPIGLVDFVAMKSGAGQARFEAELAQGRSIVSLDIVDDETLQWAGGLIWGHRSRGVFAIGSQGVEYALVAHWRAAGLLERPVKPEPASKLSQMVAVSGSISGVTAAQTEWAAANGFELIPLDAAASLDNGLWNAEIESAVKSALAALSSGRSPLVATARGPTDGSVVKFREKLSTSGVDSIEVHGRIGAGLGEVLQRVMRTSGIKRGAVSGGDTSGFAMRALGAYALEAIAPIAPGAPLCRVFSADPETDGFQITLKGGQMGDVDFFGSVRAGSATA